MKTGTFIAILIGLFALGMSTFNSWRINNMTIGFVSEVTPIVTVVPSIVTPDVATPSAAASSTFFKKATPATKIPVVTK